MDERPENFMDKEIQDKGFHTDTGGGGTCRTTSAKDAPSSNVVWEGGRSNGGWHGLFVFLSAACAAILAACLLLVLQNLDPTASSVNAGKEPTPPGCAHAYVDGDEKRHPEWLPRARSDKGKTTARWSIDPDCVRRFWSDAGNEAELRRTAFTSGFDAMVLLFLSSAGIAAAAAAFFGFLAQWTWRPRIVRILGDGSVEAGAPTDGGGGPVDAGSPPPPLAPGSDWMSGPASEGRTPKAGSHRFELIRFDPEDASGKIRLSIPGEATEIFSSPSIDKAVSKLLLSGWEPSPSSMAEKPERLLACAADQLRKRGPALDPSGSRRCVAVPRWILMSALRTASIPFVLGLAAWISSPFLETATGILILFAFGALVFVPFNISIKWEKNKFLAVEDADLLLVLQGGGRVAWRRTGDASDPCSAEMD